MKLPAETHFDELELVVNRSRDVRAVADVAARTGELATLCENTLRILVETVPEPELADEPAWLTEAMERLSRDESDVFARPGSATMDAARKLLRACLKGCEELELEAEISPDASGGIVIEWNVSPHLIQMFVEPSQLPWPGVRARVFTKQAYGPLTPLSSRYRFLAGDIARDFHDCIRRFQRATETGVLRRDETGDAAGG